MEALFGWIKSVYKYIYDVEEWVKAIGSLNPVWAYAIFGAIIFAETGLMIGFFLPGDSLLFAAGLACAPGSRLNEITHLNIWVLNAVLIPAAIIGDTVGYWIGYKAGAALYKREKTLFFRRDHLMATKAFYDRHGGKTIVIARFVPMIRTFAPVVAGIAQMEYRHFLSYNIFGGIGWIVSLSLLGYFLGQYEWIGKNLDITLMAIIFVSLLPAIIAFVKHKFLDKPAPAAAAEPGAPAAGASSAPPA